MTPQAWYRHICRTHAWGCLLEMLFHTAFLLLVARSLSLLLPLQFHKTEVLVALVIATHLAWRIQRQWTPQHRWKCLSSCDPQGWSHLLRDLATHRGHFPKQEYLQIALEEAEHWPKPQIPLWSIWSNGLRSLVLAALILGIVWSSDCIPPMSWTAHTTEVITLTPPSYLDLPARNLHPEEKEISVYPGSLLHWEGFNSKAQLSDSRERHYLPLHSQGNIFFEARILEALTFTFGEKKQLQIHLLEDQIPTVQWLGSTDTVGLEPVVLTFEAHDDHGLSETLITVNGREIEYAGKALNKKSFAYRWSFNPRDHLNLAGGNIALQISAYDNDRIRGPKVGRSPAIVWEFPGLGPISSQGLKTIEQLKQQSQDRLSENSHSSAQHIDKTLQQLQKDLAQNPAISPQILQMLDFMEQHFQPYAQANSPIASQNEKQQIQRNLDLLSNVEKLLSQIMQTIEAAKLVENLQNTAKALNKGQNVSSEFPKLYDQMEKHLRKAGIPEGIAEQILDKLNEAELSAAMGDPQGAAKILESLAEVMRQNPQGSQGASGENPMAKKFQQTLQDLQQLITRQQVNQSMLNISDRNVPKALSQEALKMRSELRKSPAFNQYQSTIQQLRRPNVGEAERKELFNQLTQPSRPAFKGRVLDQLDQQLARLTAGSNPTQPLQELLSQLGTESETLKQLAQNLHQLLSQPKGGLDPELEPQQKSIAQDAAKFSSDFRLNFEPMLPMPELYRSADLAAQAALQAQLQLPTFPDNANSLMGQAIFQWLQLQQALQNMQEQAKNNSGGSGQSLSIGKDGKLQLQPQGQGAGQRQEGDGEWQHKNENLDIALPEDFKNTHLIEQQLQQQLQNAPNDALRRSFQKYMMDLLE